MKKILSMLLLVIFIMSINAQEWIQNTRISSYLIAQDVDVQVWQLETPKGIALTLIDTTSTSQFDARQKMQIALYALDRYAESIKSTPQTLFYYIGYVWKNGSIDSSVVLENNWLISYFTARDRDRLTMIADVSIVFTRAVASPMQLRLLPLSSFTPRLENFPLKK